MRPKRAKVEIGYCGSISHRDDVRVIIPALRKALDRHPGRIAIVSIGCPLPGLEGVVGYTHHASVGATEYPQVLSALALDIGLAPLRDNAFARAKSDIKYLEYSATGALTIASPIAPYRASVHANRGIVVGEDTPEAWHGAIQRMVDEPRLREELADNAYRWVCRERSVQATATKWEAVFRRYAHGDTSHDAPPLPYADARHFARVLGNIALHEAPHDALQARRVLLRRV